MQTLYANWDEDAARQYIDAASVFRHHRRTKEASAAFRGSMTWKTVSGREYLVRLTGSGGQRSLGARNPQTQALYDDFMKRKAEHKDRLTAITHQLQLMQRLNKAVRVGRVPPIVVDVLNALDDAGLAHAFMVVDTQALHAYETAGAVRISPDLLFGTAKGLTLLDLGGTRPKSLAATLQNADPTFRLGKGQPQMAVNTKGFGVHVIQRDARDPQAAVWPSLASRRRFSQIIVGATGKMALMRTAHPLDFIAVKEQLAAASMRDAAETGRDKLQAQLVQHLWEEWLQYHPYGEPKLAGHHPAA